MQRINQKRLLAMLTILSLLGYGCAITIEVSEDGWEKCESYSETYEKVLPAKDYSEISLSNINGNIKFTAWDKPEVKIWAEKKIKAKTIEEAKEYASQLINVSQDEKRIKIVTLRGKKPHHIKNVSVSYDIHLPEGMNAVIHNTNGRIFVSDDLGRIKVNNTNGKVELGSIQGRAEVTTTNGSIQAHNIKNDIIARTTNGSIAAEIAELGKGSCEMKTTNGSITVTLPPDTSAYLKAKTTNGYIRTDIPITVAGKLARNTLEGKIGDGQSRIILHTTNGNIYVKKSD